LRTGVGTPKDFFAVMPKYSSPARFSELPNDLRRVIICPTVTIVFSD
jgi:hypothetical protein